MRLGVFRQRKAFPSISRRKEQGERNGEQHRAEGQNTLRVKNEGKNPGWSQNQKGTCPVKNFLLSALVFRLFSPQKFSDRAERHYPAVKGIRGRFTLCPRRGLGQTQKLGQVVTLVPLYSIALSKRLSPSKCFLRVTTCP
jgi:hypothetical protein